jgi:hypothetical protein
MRVVLPAFIWFAVGRNRTDISLLIRTSKVRVTRHMIAVRLLARSQHAHAATAQLYAATSLSIWSFIGTKLLFSRRSS